MTRIYCPFCGNPSTIDHEWFNDATSTINELRVRAEAAEARVADLAEDNREKDEAIKTLRAERDEQATRIIELESTTAAYKIGNDELKRIIETLRTERNEAWSSLKDARDTIQDLTL